jgi:hypothetical protein
MILRHGSCPKHEKPVCLKSFHMETQRHRAIRVLCWNGCITFATVNSEEPLFEVSNPEVRLTGDIDEAGFPEPPEGFVGNLFHKHWLAIRLMVNNPPNG